ncbi:MAG: hypothetical protein HC901_01760 [Bdellovibrionaceae bacterium]|nr:hypothetical protein [Pseudobdellovibrionaceae bacterium]
MHAPLMVAESKARPGSLPMEHSFLSLQDGHLQLSAIKQASRGNELVLRLFNPHETARRETLRLAVGIDSARYANLNEEADGRTAPVLGGTVTVEAGPKQIVTLLLGLARAS